LAGNVSAALSSLGGSLSASVSAGLNNGLSALTGLGAALATGMNDGLLGLIHTGQTLAGDLAAGSPAPRSSNSPSRRNTTTACSTYSGSKPSRFSTTLPGSAQSSNADRISAATGCNTVGDRRG
jgi:hypothetical protein